MANTAPKKDPAVVSSPSSCPAVNVHTGSRSEATALLRCISNEHSCAARQHHRHLRAATLPLLCLQPAPSSRSGCWQGLFSGNKSHSWYQTVPYVLWREGLHGQRALALDPCPYLLIGPRCPDASCVHDFVRPWGEVEKQTDPGGCAWQIMALQHLWKLRSKFPPSCLPYPLVCVTGCVMIHNDFAFRARVPFTTPHILIPPSQPLAVC